MAEEPPPGLNDALSVRTKTMYHSEDAQYFEALLGTLIAQVGRPIRLAVRDIANCGNHYRLGVQSDSDSATVTLALVDWKRQHRPATRRLPKR